MILSRERVAFLSMNGQTCLGPGSLAAKIARLVAERGCNQEDFVRQTGLNRQTVRQILRQNGARRLRNATIGACAKGLGLTVSELHDLPLERLLPRMQHEDKPGHAQRPLLYDAATQPELLGWLERNPERARCLSAEDRDELLSLQGTGGPLTSFGVEHFVEILERKRQLVAKIHAIAGTEYLALLEQVVELLYEKIQPFRERA